MKPKLQELTEQYASALENYLAGGGEAALQQAYEIGRRALADGLGVLEMADLHHEALVKALPRVLTLQEHEKAAKAIEKFLVESLTPFEMTHRGFREAGTALQASEERYRELFENANDIVFTTDLSGNFTSINPAGERLSGYSRDEAPSINFAQIVARQYLHLARQMLEQKIAGGGATIYELEIVTKDGRCVPVEVSTRLIYQEGRPTGVQGIARDVTERKRAEGALRRLNEALEDEAKRIAHALHDEAGQLLVSVHIALEEVARELPAPARERLQRIRGLLDQIEEQLRRLSHELRPTILDDLGLVPALEFLAQGVSARAGTPISVEGSSNGRLPPAIETAAYRIVSEGLLNATKHARANRVTVRVERQDQKVICVIQDDGIGFDVPSAMGRRGGHGLGLISIRERLSPLGGTLSIQSKPGWGTVLEITIPVQS